MFDEPCLLTRDLLTLAGPDASKLLNGLLTTNVEALAVGAIGNTALLTPQGKILDAMFIVRTAEDAFLLDCWPGRGEGLKKRLMFYRLRAKVDISLETDQIAVGVGPAPSAAKASGPDPRLGVLPPRFYLSRAEAGQAAFGDETYADEEVRLGVPAYGIAYAEGDAFPLGVNLDVLGGIDHKKGCFVGQEVASRMFRKGDVRKRSWHVVGEGAHPCTELTRDGQMVATVTAARRGYGLAVMRLDRLDPGSTEVTVQTPDGKPVILSKPGYLP